MDNLKRSNQKVNLLIITFLIISFVSCIPQKRLVLMQSENIIDSTYANTFDGSEFEDSVYRIQPNDYLYINISSVEKKITDFFAPLTAVNYISGENQALTGYAVNDKGNIEFPYVGTIHLQGQTLEECVETMRLATAKYVGKARIEIRLINNTISVLGEVEKQGVYRMTKSKIDIYEAITLASGFKDFAKRNKVKVMRTVDGNRKLYLVNLNDGRLISKNMFYVYPNDVLYVEPMRSKTIRSTTTSSLSIITALGTIAVIILSIVK